MAWREDEDGKQRIAVGITVVGEHTGSRDAQRRVLGYGEGVVDRRRRLVDVLDGEVDRGQVARQGAVADQVREGVRTVIIRLGAVDERAIDVERHRPMRRREDEDGEEGIAVGVAVVSEHTRRRDPQRCVKVDRKEVVIRRRRFDRG